MRKLIATAGLLVLTAGAATAQTAETRIVHVEPLQITWQGKVSRILINPWFKVTRGASFTVLPLGDAPERMDFTASRVKKRVGHCYAENIHQVHIDNPDTSLHKKVKPTGKDRNGNPVWPMAFFISPAAPNARLMTPSAVKAPDLPKGQNPVNVVAAVDISGNGFADAVLLRTCSGYDMKPQKTQAQLDAMDHRQCPKKVPVFRHLYLRTKGAWKQVWYEDLC